MTPSWTVRVGVAPADYLLVDVTSIAMDVGITQVTDQLRAGSCTIQGRNPDSQPAIAVGDRIQIAALTSLGYIYFVFRVKNFVVDYGPVEEQDVWTLTGEDVFAQLGRATQDVSWFAGDRTDEAAVTLCDTAGVSVNVATVGQSTVSAQTLTNVNGLAELTKLVQTEQAAVYSYSTNTVWWLGRGWQNVAVGGYLADDGSTYSGLTTYVYDSLRFGGIADNYANKVIVSPAGLAAQESGTGDYAYTINSYDETTTQAAGLAAYMTGVLDVQDAVPYEVSVFSQAQSVDTVIGLCVPYKKLLVMFRGTLFAVFVLGFTVSAVPDGGTRVTFRLGSAESVPYMILDDPVFGRLDYNRLGF